MNVRVREISTGTYLFEDGEWQCQHDNIEIEDNSFDYAGTHCNYGQAGTHVQYNAVCQDCGEDVSESYDWTPDEPDYED